MRGSLTRPLIWSLLAHGDTTNCSVGASATFPLSQESQGTIQLSINASQSVLFSLYPPFRVVFPHRKRSAKKGEIVQKRFIVEDYLFHFGPLHSGKSRERYREGRFPENMEKLTINNNGCLESEVSFCFKEDSNTSTFLLAPTSMKLQPGESKVVADYSTCIQ